MEEESEKISLTQNESPDTKVEVPEQTVDDNKENVTAESSTLIQIENNKEEKKSKLFSFFERKKVSASESNENPSETQSSGFKFSKLLFKKDTTPKSDAEESLKVETEQPPQPNAATDEAEEKEKPKKSYLPSFSGLVNRFRRGKYEVAENIELNNEPKAGLASMETLDDSTKDPWTPENDNESPTELNGSSKKPADGDAEKTKDAVDSEIAAKEEISLWQSIQNYECSIDDIALFGGLITFIFLVLLIVFFTLTASPRLPISAPIRNGKVLASTSCGYVEGIVEDHAAIAFRGIPYAKPPINERRFENAEIIDDIKFCWNGTFEAHNATPPCLQYDNSGNIMGTEDCLTLDIVTPEVRYINLMPVIVEIGADSFLGGSPNILRPSSKYARSKSVIFVRPNFRLNVFGFLALDTISNSSKIPTSGNYALSDIIAVLEWINLNIHHFGGDKNQITVWGHRAGATLVTALSSYSKATNLFSRIWASSGSSHFPGKDLKDSELANTEYGNSFPDCKEKKCWQKKTTTDLLNMIPASWKREFNSLPAINEKSTDYHDWMVLDGVILKRHVEDSWKSAKTLPKIVIGTTAHSIFDPTNPSVFAKNFTEEEIEKYVSDSIIGQRNLTDEVFKLYGKTKEGLISLISDIRTVCPLLVQARSKPDITFYIVTQTGDENLSSVDLDVQAILGRYHASTPEKRRYLDAVSKLFYYYVYHGKILHSTHNKILEIEQDVDSKDSYKNCDFLIANNIVPHYAAH